MVIKHLKRPDSRKIMRVLNEEGKGVFVLQDNGRIRAFSLETYMAKCQQAKAQKPWLYRKKMHSSLGPIGSQPLGIRGRLSRESIYEGG